MTMDAKLKERLAQRGLDLAICEALGFRIQNGVLAHDYRVNGRVVNTKLRKGKGDMPWVRTLSGGEVLPLWNIDSLKAPAMPGEVLVIVEGELDGATVVQSGFSRVVSIPDGAPATPGSSRSYAYLFADKAGKKLHPDVDKFDKIVLAVDGDEKGQFLFDDLVIRLGRHRCASVSYPEDCKDANDLLQRGLGVDGVKSLISNSKFIWADSIGRMSDFPSRISKAHHVDIADLNLKIELPSFMVMLGPHHCGKSTFLRQMLWTLWKSHGWGFLLTCLEEPVRPRTQRKFQSLALGTTAIDCLPMVRAGDLGEADEAIEKAGVFLERPRDRLLDPGTFLDMAETAVKRYGLRVVALDPVNELDHHIDGNETHYWGNFILDCKALADRYGLLFIASGHPAKDGPKDLQRKELLRATHMSGSANWGNKGDIVMCFWRPSDEADVTLLHMEKLKDHETMGKAPWLYEMTHELGKNSFKITDQGWHLWKKEEKSK